MAWHGRGHHDLVHHLVPPATFRALLVVVSDEQVLKPLQAGNLAPVVGGLVLIDEPGSLPWEFLRLQEVGDNSLVDLVLFQSWVVGLVEHDQVVN